MTQPIQIRLQPEQGAVLHALQRIASAVALEAAQIEGTWHQPGVAAQLKDLVGGLNKLADAFLKDVQRSIIVAQEMPPELPGIIQQR